MWCSYDPKPDPRTLALWNCKKHPHCLAQLHHHTKKRRVDLVFAGFLEPFCTTTSDYFFSSWVEPVPLDCPSPLACPAFVVGNQNKPRAVVDLHTVNSIFVPNAYLLPCQDEIPGALDGTVIFSAMHITHNFFQQPIRPRDC